MERSEETLSTRDLAQPNEPAHDRGAAGDAAGGVAERGTVYDQERIAQDEPAGSTASGEPVGIETRGDDVARSGAQAPPDADAAAAAPGVGASAGDAGGDSVTGAPPVGASTGDVAGDSVAGAPGAGASTADGGRDSVAGAPGPGVSTADGAGDSAQLLSAEASSNLQRRWEEVQTRFVDEPRGAVEQADGLVANLMQQLAEGFAQERERLEAQWDRGEDISTEDLRIALQRYRSFFHRLLSA